MLRIILKGFHSCGRLPASIVRGLWLALCVAVMMAGAPVQAQDLAFELIEVIPDAPAGDDIKRWTVSDGHISLKSEYGDYSGEHTWTSPPATFGSDGFDITIGFQAIASPSRHSGGTQVWGDGFTFDRNPPSVEANAADGQTASDSATIHVTPPNAAPGSIVEFHVGAFWSYKVTYRYRASGGGVIADDGDDGDDGTEDDDGVIDDDERRLAAHLDCPPSIIISELPSLNCHIVITSWRYSADPVEVILPGALDAYGNHANGIQLLQAAGNQDVFNWSAPYLWGMFVFACPSQDNTGANCFGSVTTPGPKSVEIIVRQGPDEVPLQLVIDAIPRPGGVATACGFTVGQAILDKWNSTGGQGGFLGCATSDEQAAGRSPSGADARQTLFQGGVIVLHGSGRLAGSAFEVHGSIGARYLGMGGTSSWLGLPISDEYDMPGGRRSDFENGYIAWDPLTGGSILMRDGSAAVSFEPDINRGGSDFTRFEAIGDRLEVCRDACAAESTCVAYTFVRPGLQGPRGVCWLKSSVPEASVDGCCISGVKR